LYASIALFDKTSFRCSPEAIIVSIDRPKTAWQPRGFPVRL
jgi:hypothetical protein